MCSHEKGGMNYIQKAYLQVKIIQISQNTFPKSLLFSPRGLKMCIFYRNISGLLQSQGFLTSPVMLFLIQHYYSDVTA